MAEAYSIKKLTDRAWVLHQGGFPFAFIHTTPAGKLAMLTGDELVEYNSLEEITTHVGGKVSEMMVIESDEVDSEIKDHIDGYPVKHAKVTVERGGSTPVYLRGKTQHVAGYWCIKFSKRFVPSFCPLLKTVEQYESTGPFKSRFEMMANLATLNR